MVSRQTDKEATSVRVYKYGLVPIGHPPETVIEELWRSNRLWNDLVALHRENSEAWDDARCVASIQYSELNEALEVKNSLFLLIISYNQ
jgi:hypothetical protein